MMTTRHPTPKTRRPRVPGTGRYVATVLALPALVVVTGLALVAGSWSQLPAVVASHWGPNGVDGTQTLVAYTVTATAFVVGLSLLLALVAWVMPGDGRRIQPIDALLQVLDRPLHAADPHVRPDAQDERDQRNRQDDEAEENEFTHGQATASPARSPAASWRTARRSTLPVPSVGIASMRRRSSRLGSHSRGNSVRHKRSHSSCGAIAGSV